MVDYNLLKDLLLSRYGASDALRIMQGYGVERAVTLRVNTLKSDRESVKAKLCANGIAFREVGWYGDALIIDGVREDAIKKLDIYSQGHIYLQSLSSMIPPLLLGALSNECILDMAAAPGGKTTQIAALTGNKAQITACEKDKIRAERLKYNIGKQGARAYVMTADCSKLDNMFSFDKILLDAPCSGSGTIKIKGGNIGGAFSQKLLDNSIRLQVAMLTKALTLLKKGGTLVYSTCSVLPDENGEVIKKVLPKFNAEIARIDSDGFIGVPTLKSCVDGTLTVCPNELYEGFFVAVITKRG